MSLPTKCKACGGEISASAQEGLCPDCLAKLVVENPLAKLAPQSATEILSDAGGEQQGDRIGNYRLQQKIGEGGFGVVYMAEQEQPVRRRVALKVIKLGMDTRQVVARFEAERQALALMDHPNIARVLDAGATESGRPYFVMELVKGIAITKYCDQNHLDLNARLDLFIRICHAIQHAHQKGIIHRDIKPSNVMVTMHDGVPVPKVIDFGIAKATEMRLTDKTLFTQYEQFMGTPAYMSPEQAEMTGLDIDTRSDIYSLGVLLYELLTGRPPFSNKELVERGIEEARRTIRETEPPRPSTRLSTLTHADLNQIARERSADGPKLRSLVRGDLDWIVMKCLEKDRTRRYETANGLGLDIKRFLNQEPIVARPPSQVYLFQKLVRRHKTAFAGAAVVLAALFAGLGLSTWSFLRERAARTQLEQARAGETTALGLARQNAEAEALQRAQAQAAVTRLETERAELLFASDNSAEGLAAVAGALRQNPTNAVIAARLMSALSHRNICLPTAVLRHDPPITTAGVDRGSGVFSATAALTVRHRSIHPFRHKASITSAQFSPDGRRVLTASKDKTARIWDGNTGSLLVRLEHDAEVLCAQFSPDGMRVVTASMDRTATVWDVATGQRLTEPFQHGGAVVVVEFSPDGEQIVTGSEDRKARIWNSRSGQLLTTLEHKEMVVFARFRGDGRQLLTTDPGKAILWDLITGKPLPSFFQDERRSHPEFSPDGHLMITMDDRLGMLTDVPSGNARGVPVRHDQVIYFASFSPDNLSLATASRDNTARLWDAQTGQPIAEPLQHGNEVVCVRFSPDGRRVVTASWDNTARIWDARRGRPLSEPLLHNSRVLFAEFSPDGQRVLTVAEGTDAVIWDIRSRQPLALRLSHAKSREVLAVQFSPNGERIVTGSRDRTARIWNALTGEQVTELKPDGQVRSAQFSPNGEQIVTAGYEDARVRVWNAATGRPEGQSVGHGGPGTSDHAEFSPDGQRVVSVGRDRTARIWNYRTGEQLARLEHDDEVYSAQFSPNGQYVVTASYDQTARLWESRTGRRLFTLKHDHFVVSAWFSPDGEQIVSASKDKTARIWQVATGKMLTEPLQHDDELLSAFFSPDGSRVVTSAGNSAHIWDARTGEPHTRRLKHNARVNHARFSPDGRQIVTACNDGTVRIWDAETAYPLTEPFRHDSIVSQVVFSPDGRQIASASADGTAGLWEVPLVSLPIPAWLPDLAEAVAGQRFNTRNMSEPVPLGELFKLKVRLTTRTAADVYSQWAKWFFAQSATRAVSPSSPISVTEYVQRRVDENTLPGLQEAVWLSPTNGLAQARLAWMALTNDSLRNPRLAAESDWQTRRAIEQCPKDPEVWWVWAQFCERLGKASESWAALEKAAALKSIDPRFWNTWGSMLEGTNRLDDALQAYTRAIELSGPSKDRRGSLAATVLENRSKLFKRMNRLAEAAADNLAAHNLPARDPSSPSALIDLSTVYNITHRGDWRWPGRTNLVRMEWDMRGYVELKPDAPISGIPMMQRCRRLHFLHRSAQPRSTRIKNIGIYRIHYVDGEKHEIRLVAQGEAPLRFENQEFWPTTRFWKGLTTTNSTNYWMPLHLSTWSNPRPEVPIATIDLLPTTNSAGSFVVAITADDRPDEESPEFWNAHGLSLEQTNRLEEALQAFTRAIELDGPARSQTFLPGSALENRLKLFRRMNRLPEAAADNTLALKLPPRAQDTPPELIDLTAFYNFTLDRETSLGRQTFGNIQFDVRAGMFVLTNSQGSPPRISGITVARKSRRLHFLHAANSETVREGAEIGAYVIHYAGGSSNTIPIVYGRDVRNGTSPEITSSESKPRPVWQRVTGTGFLCRLYKTAWDNPAPDLGIETIDFISRRTDVYPILIAITAEP